MKLLNDIYGKINMGAPGKKGFYDGRICSESGTVWCVWIASKDLPKLPPRGGISTILHILWHLPNRHPNLLMTALHVFKVEAFYNYFQKVAQHFEGKCSEKFSVTDIVCNIGKCRWSWFDPSRSFADLISFIFLRKTDLFWHRLIRIFSILWNFLNEDLLKAKAELDLS